MLDCKIINNKINTDTPELVRQNLFEWCDNEKDIDCSELKKTDKIGSCLISIFDKDIKDNTDFFNDIDNRILEKNKTYIQLQNMENKVMDYTNEADLNILEKLNKTKIHEIIYLIIYLIIAWCFGIYIIFNYFVI
jgi:hypothetical protein